MTTIHLKCALSIVFITVTASGQSEITGGGSARNVALGGSPSNPYLSDILRVHINPALAAQYRNVIWGDVGFLSVDNPQGGSRGQYVAGTAAIAEHQTIGMALNRRESPLYTVDPLNPSRDPIQEMNTMVASVLGFDAQPFAHPLSPLEVFWAMSNDSGAFGASVSYGRWSGARSGNGESKQSATSLRLKLGILHRSPAGTLFDMAVFGGLNDISGTATSAAGVPKELSLSGGLDAGLDIRIDAPLAGAWRLVPIARGYWFSWGMKEVRNGALVIPDPASEYSHLELDAGAGVNFSNNGFLLSGGLSIGYLNDVKDYRSTKTTVTTLDVPKINLGAEIPLASWIVGRVGYFDRLSSTETKVESGGTTTTMTNSAELPWYGDLNGLSAAQQRVTLGLGLRYAGASLDGTIGEGYFLNGPWPLSGTAQSVFGMISIDYQY